MAGFCTELLAVLVLTTVTAYGTLMGGAPAQVALDFSTIVSLMGLGITVGNAAARELATMAVRWGVRTILHMLLI